MKDGIGVTKDDLASEMWIACHRALQRYDPNGGASLKTWLFIYARCAAAKAYQRGTLFGRAGDQKGAQPVGLSLELERDIPQYDEMVDEAVVSALIDTLPCLLAKRLRGYVFDGKPLTDGVNKRNRKRILAEVQEIQQRLRPLMTGA